MPILPMFSFRGLARFFTRELRDDRRHNAEADLHYAIQNNIVSAEDGPKLARQLAPRHLKRAVRRVEAERQSPTEPKASEHEDRPRPDVLDAGQSPDARLALPKGTGDDIDPPTASSSTDD